jgi:hypothetical protein
VAQQQGACKAATNRTRSEVKVANVLIPIPNRSVTYHRHQQLSAKVRQLGAFEGQSELLVGVAPLRGVEAP